MGVLSFVKSWDLLKKAEVVFEQRLRENPFYPFHEVCTADASENYPGRIPVFVYSARLKRFYLALLLTIATLLFIIIWPSANGDTEYLVFAGFVLAVSIYCTVEFYSVRTIVLDPSNEHYSVYRESLLIATQHCHNIYVRMHCNRTGPRHPTYRLVLDGYGLVSSVRLTGESTNRRKLRHLAQELAARLHVNYFDVHNSSKHHIVRHYRPEKTSLVDHEE